ncbi:GNAT family N-acetyltransferase [Nonomuraea cavernae]|uniref:N-acetyltransferase n=1 Tax=Nonomuraea cavernae TaxID=2045107 RepID=A0A917Z1M3_9ACTN|nr:GNAT family N-acetyltransferase [Nonomuraea cavernae]MCA2187951.1 GNAT family N-acetyltransferase [Nonomuraea cavernae]GGO72343.1 N-acetyltransferase [Nonomuraea cavernae]
MGDARRATAADAAELVRLRGVMFADLPGQESEGDAWMRSAVEALRRRLDEPDPSMVAFVVERPDRPGELAACAVGAVEFRLGGPRNPSGVSGYVFNVVTDLAYRRRGYSRLCVTALLDWYRDRGITAVHLRASTQGEPLYRSLGFVRTADPAMRLKD